MSLFCPAAAVRQALRSAVVATLLLSGCVHAQSAAAPDAPAEQTLTPGVTITKPFAGVEYRRIIRSSPTILQAHVVVVDLTNPKVHVSVKPGGEDPDGKGKWQTVLQPVLKIATAVKSEVAVNGDFFAIPKPEEMQSLHQPVVGGEGGATTGPTGVGYAPGMWATVSGPAMTDGKLWATAAKPRPSLIISGKNVAKLEAITTAPAGAKQIIAGNDFLVKQGKALFEPAPEDKPYTGVRQRHPRTAVGVSQDGKMLIILVADGRWINSVGLDYAELSSELVAQGAYTAINLDGGGSSTLIMTDAVDGKPELKNKPQGKTFTRAVANALCVDVEK